MQSVFSQVAEWVNSGAQLNLTDIGYQTTPYFKLLNEAKQDTERKIEEIKSKLVSGKVII